MGDAILGAPSLSPTMPRESTNARENGSKLSTANTRARVRTTALCRSPTSAHTPVSGKMSSSAHTSIQLMASPFAAWPAGPRIARVLSIARSSGLLQLLVPRRRPMLGALPDEHDARIGRGRVDERAEALELVGIVERRLPLALVAADHARHLRLQFAADPERVVDQHLPQ